MYTTYYEKPYLSIYQDTEKSLGKSVWNGFVSGSEYREAMQACLKLMQTQQIRYWVADDREMKAIRLKDQEWSNEVLMPQLTHSSLQKLALIVSNDMFNQLAVDSMIQKAADGINFEIKYFASVKKAEKWIEDCIQETVSAKLQTSHS